MANYNTFIVVDCKNRKNILTTSSARKAKKLLADGIRIDIWNNNEKVNTIYCSNCDNMAVYIAAERAYIGQKQRKAEQRNRRRRVNK